MRNFVNIIIQIIHAFTYFDRFFCHILGPFSMTCVFWLVFFAPWCRLLPPLALPFILIGDTFFLKVEGGGVCTYGGQVQVQSFPNSVVTNPTSSFKRKHSFSCRVSDTQLFHLLIYLRRKSEWHFGWMLEPFQKKSARRPLIVAGQCRRLLLLLLRSWCCAELASLLEVSPRPSLRCSQQHHEEGRDDET